MGFEPVREGERIDAGPGSYGVTDADGRYRLTTIDGRSGAVVGMHRVWVRTFQAEEGPNGPIVPIRPERVPKHDNVETGLVFEVSQGGNGVWRSFVSRRQS